MASNFLHHYDGPSNNPHQAYDSSSLQGGEISNVSELQKKFLRNEYIRQQEVLDRKKEENTRQKESDFDRAVQERREYDDHLQREKLLQADKKRIIADHNRLQIEQATRDKAAKKQQELDEDKQRLRLAEENHRWDMDQKLQQKQQMRQEIGISMNSKPTQPERRIPAENIQNQLGITFESDNIQKRQQLERFEHIHAANQRNFVSYEDEKQRRAEVFSRSNNTNNFQRPPLHESSSNNNNSLAKREHNEALKRQMVENQQRKELERHDRYQSTPFLSKPEKPQQQQVQQQQYFQDSSAAKSEEGLSKKLEQQRYREFLDLQAQEKKNQSLNDRASQNSYNEQQKQQFEQQQQQYNSKNNNNNLKLEYDVMGNLRPTHSSSTTAVNSRGGVASRDMAAAEQKREEQQRYRDILLNQVEQNRQLKSKEEDQYALEQQFQGILSLGSQQPQRGAAHRSSQSNRGEENKQYGSYNPITNSVNQVPAYKNAAANNGSGSRNGKFGFEDEQQQGYGRVAGSNLILPSSNNRIDYSAFANKNLLGNPNGNPIGNDY